MLIKRCTESLFLWYDVYVRLTNKKLMEGNHDSVDGSKLKYISTQSYNGKVYTKKLLSNCYFVCKTEI